MYATPTRAAAGDELTKLCSTCCVAGPVRPGVHSRGAGTGHIAHAGLSASASTGRWHGQQRQGLNQRHRQRHDSTGCGDDARHHRDPVPCRWGTGAGSAGGRTAVPCWCAVCILCLPSPRQLRPVEVHATPVGSEPNAPALVCSAGDMHAELQRRLCTDSAHDRIVASLAASACAAGRREAGQSAELPAAFVERVLLLLLQAKFSSPDAGTFNPV